MTKEWDLNIFFEDLGYDEDRDEEISADVISINPVLWMKREDGTTDVDYTDIVYKTTFAEARYIRSEYPEDEYGYDWTDSLENFLKIAPPRLRTLLSTLPDAGTVVNAKSLTS
jgi:hypothetical protein